MSLKLKFEIFILICFNILTVLVAVSSASVLTFLLVYAALFVTSIIASRDLFKAIDYKQTDEQILIAHGIKLLESGRVTLFIALITTMDVLLVLFILPESFPDTDPSFSRFPGLHLLLFLFTFAFPYAVYQFRGEKLEKIFTELLSIDFIEKIKNLPLEELPEFVISSSSSTEAETSGKSNSLTPERYKELLDERDSFFEEYYPALSGLFIGKNISLNSYYLTEILRKKARALLEI